ncbi:MAG: nucleoside-diphosphate kinase [Chitinispirillaceae bacterium]|nr:nucleoside-diphosphate kinase [Chitinispirillaceae bacterium]
MIDKELEQTLVLIKPDALKNSLTGYVLSLLSEFHTGLRFAGTKIVHVTTMLASEHYAEHRGKIFYESLIEYIRGNIHYPGAPEKQRVIAIVYQGVDAVKKLRDIAGPTNPLNARDQKPGCIRSLGTLAPLKDTNGTEIGQRMDNLIHASANHADAEREIKLWFRPNDIPPAMHAYATKESDDHFYYKSNRLFTTHEPGSDLILAPGDIAWESDFNALRALLEGRESAISLEAVVAKYLINKG